MSVTFEKAPAAEPAAEPAEGQATVEVATTGDIPGTDEGQQPAHQQELEEPEESGLRDRLPSRAEIGQRAKAGMDTVWAWIQTQEISEEDLLVQVAARQQTTRERAEQELRHQVDRLHQRIVETEAQASREAGEHGQAGAARRASANLRAELAQAEAQLRRRIDQNQAAVLPPSARDLKRARRARQVQRGCAVVGAVVVGGVLLPIHAPLITPVVLLAAATALWKLGARPPESEQPEEPRVMSVGMGMGGKTAVPPGGLPGARTGGGDQAQQDATLQDAVPAGQPVVLEDLVQADAAPVVVPEVEKASQDWLMERLVEAGVVTSESSKRAKIISMLTQGPGWTATVAMPPGKKAADAIARSGEIASALGRKASQVEMAVDTSEEGHEGRFTMWVSDKANPYGGPPVPSLLVDAERWDFWRDGVPLGADARGIRKILALLWSSLLVGGLQRYGKTYFVRLIAAAAALDPHVRIVLISAKPSADWLPLQKIAYKFVVGKTPDKIREAYETIDALNGELDEVGHRLERLAEQDLSAVPEGKLTRALYRDPRFGLTLLIVDELQNLLLSAAEVKSGPRPNDPAYASMIRGKLTVFNRMNSSQGGMSVVVVHRPGPDSPVTPDLRDAFAARASYRVKGIDSARNVLGPDAVSDGAAPHALLEVHKGVAVVDLGEDGGHYTLKADMITLQEFDGVCTRGRLLRKEAGTLTGFAAESAEAEQADTERRSLIEAVIAAIETAGGEGGRTEDLAAAMATADPGRYGDLTGQRLGEMLRSAGAGGTVKLPRQADGSRPNGYRLDTLQTLLRRGSAPA